MQLFPIAGGGFGSINNRHSKNHIFLRKCREILSVGTPFHWSDKKWNSFPKKTPKLLMREATRTLYPETWLSVEDTFWFYFACFLKAEPLGLKALTIPLPKLPKGEVPGTRRGEQEHMLKHIQPWLYASPMTSNSRVLLGYRWAQSVMQAWSVPRPAAKMRYPWKEGIL